MNFVSQLVSDAVGTKLAGLSFQLPTDQPGGENWARDRNRLLW